MGDTCRVINWIWLTLVLDGSAWREEIPFNTWYFSDIYQSNQFQSIPILI
jgi:hypothetical protein